MNKPLKKRLIANLESLLAIVEFSDFSRTRTGIKSADIRQIEIDIEALKNEK